MITMWPEDERPGPPEAPSYVAVIGFGRMNMDMHVDYA